MKPITSHLDPLDQRLLDCLQENARTSVSELARQLSISRTTVQMRIQRLESAGVILGYTINKADDIVAGQVSALVLISLSSKNSVAVVRQLSRTSQVRKLHTLSGQYDLCAILSAPSTRLLDDALDAIRELDGVLDTLSSILLSCKVDR